MPTVALTDRFLRGLDADDSGVEYRDSTAPGLVVRVGGSGKTSFSFVYRLGGREAQRRRLGLGSYPALSLSEARKLVVGLRLQLAQGLDPAVQRRKEEALATTLNDVAARFFADYGESQWGEELRRIFAFDIAPVLGAVPAGELRRGQIVELLDQVKRRAPSMANRIRKLLRQIYRWALERELVDRDPTVGIREPVAMVSRDRVLTTAELRLLVPELDAYPGPAAVVLTLELFTAQRGGEICGIRLSEIDGEWWTIPKARTKSRRADHSVYLTPTTRRLLALGHPAPRSGLLFTGPKGSAIEAATLGHAMARVSERAGVVNARPHDLRRTAATLMAEAGVLESVIAVVLGHADRGSPRVTGVYNRYRYAAEKQAAMIALEGLLLDLLGIKRGDPSKDVGKPPPTPPSREP